MSTMMSTRLGLWPQRTVICSAVSAASAASASAHCLAQQRRLSSSKASCPPASSNGPPAKAPSAAAPGRPRTKYAASLPRAPDVQHLNRHQIEIASFFALHRPISVTSAIPAPASNETFHSIFKARKRSAVAGTGDEAPQMHSRQVESWVAQLPPFQPPHPPLPESELVQLSPEVENKQQQQRRFRATFELVETTSEDGHTTYTATSWPTEVDMQLISVRRQRKLKMKKHKFKKLRKRTRTLRRRQGKT
ncbi:hypothetical protein K470DRAFT_272626 [Piedraia hortae CBS 480.64]|uniref:Small ribosomal subunit protein mS38 n=1 Tax=Piedraia hortae CBS 480.64 TaxID=1314780 RepID=A0A6A7BTZ9_9PEZI|nr:hypothetical protein K470DRAFT_272626 [Piedraia hortae CBS 480.64]